MKINNYFAIVGRNLMFIYDEIYGEFEVDKVHMRKLQGECM